MKKLVFFFSVFIFFVIQLSGQYFPGGINYQAIARDNSGNELKNKNIDVKITIISDNPSGDTEYAETHSITTDGFGLFNIVIGQGSFVLGKKSSLSDIGWGNSPKYMKVEVDFGNGYLSMGTMPFLAVPYALHSGTASNALTSNDYQQLSYNPVTGELSLTNGGKIFIDTNDSDADPANEIQYLSVSGDTLKLSKGGEVILSPKVAAFRATRTGGNPLNAGDTIELKFTDETLDSYDSFDPTSGRFTVPSGSAGLYRFDVNYHFKDEDHLLFFSVCNSQQLRIYEEKILNWPGTRTTGYNSYSTIVDLKEGDYVSIHLINLNQTIPIYCQPTIFSGHRLH